MSSKTICTPTHIGKDVPDELAFHALLTRISNGAKRTESGCWEWQGFVTRNGYGMTAFRGRNRPVHRLMYMIQYGTMPKGMDVMHKCDNASCCNPDHLELGTRRQNIRDCVARKRHHLAKMTHCKRGHEFTAANTFYDVKNNSRHCKACNRARHRIKAGWPVDLAYAMPGCEVGFRPKGITYGNPKPNSGKYRKPERECPRGHLIAGDNVYTNPDGYRKCRRCRTDATLRFRPTKPAPAETRAEHGT